MEVFYNIVLFLSGLGLLVVAMDMVGKNMQSILGQSITKRLQKLSKKPVVGSVIGAGGTVALQSSTAMIVLLISFVQIGAFSIAQSLPIVIGINVGASLIFTSLLANAFNISLIFSLVTIFGAFIKILAKSSKVRAVGNVIFAFGILFLGLYLISHSMSFIKSLDFVSNLFETLTNPILLILLGVGLSLLTQSSLATNAIIISLCVTGADIGLALTSAFWISVGSRVGPTSAGILASLGKHKSTKIVALFHLLFNLFALTLFAISTLTHWTIFLENFNNPALALVVFNIICSSVTGLVLLPFVKPLGKLLAKVFQSKKQKTDVFEMDENLYAYPELAFAQIDKQIETLFNTHTQNFNSLIKYCFDEDDTTDIKSLEKKNELFYQNIDRAKANLASLNLNVSEAQKETMYYYFDVVGRLKSLTDRMTKILKISAKKPTKQFTKEQISLAYKLVEYLNELNKISYKFIMADSTTFEGVDQEMFDEAFRIDSEIAKIKLEAKEKIIYSYQNAVSRTKYTDNYARLINQLEQIGEHYSALCFFDNKLIYGKEE